MRICVWVEGDGRRVGLAQDGGFLAIEFFFREGAFVAELLELTYLMDNAVLGVGGGVVGGIAAGVAGRVGRGPDEADDPGDEGPAQEKIDGKDAAGARVAAQDGNDGRKEIEDKADAAEGEAKGPLENVERIVKHGWINLVIFFFESVRFWVPSTLKCKAL